MLFGCKECGSHESGQIRLIEDEGYTCADCIIKMIIGFNEQVATIEAERDALKKKLDVMEFLHPMTECSSCGNTFDLDEVYAIEKNCPSCGRIFWAAGHEGYEHTVEVS